MRTLQIQWIVCFFLAAGCAGNSSVSRSEKASDEGPRQDLASDSGESATPPETVAGAYLVQTEDTKSKPGFVIISANLFRKDANGNPVRLDAATVAIIKKTWSLLVDGKLFVETAVLGLQEDGRNSDKTWTVPVRADGSVPLLEASVEIPLTTGEVVRIDQAGTSIIVGGTATSGLTPKPTSTSTSQEAAITDHILFITKLAYLPPQLPQSFEGLTADTPECDNLKNSFTGPKESGSQIANRICQCEASQSSVPKVKERTSRFEGILNSSVGISTPELTSYATAFNNKFPLPVVDPAGTLISRAKSLMNSDATAFVAVPWLSANGTLVNDGAEGTTFFSGLPSNAPGPATQPSNCNGWQSPDAAEYSFGTIGVAVHPIDLTLFGNSQGACNDSTIKRHHLCISAARGGQKSLPADLND